MIVQYIKNYRDKGGSSHETKFVDKYNMYRKLKMILKYDTIMCCAIKNFNMLGTCTTLLFTIVLILVDQTSYHMRYVTAHKMLFLTA